MNLEFELVEGGEPQVQALYDLLKCRLHLISHDKLPDYKEHKSFVQSHPYRLWYLIKNPSEYVGSFSVKTDNSIGLNLKYVNDQIVLSFLEFVQENLSPIEPIASVVPNYFYINVASSNIELIFILDKILGRQLQVSYKI